MASSNPGEENGSNSELGSHVDDILPANVDPGSTLSFGVNGSMRPEILPNRAIGGVMEITGQVGENSQFKVDVKLTMQRRPDPDTNRTEPEKWIVKSTIYRNERTREEDLNPFNYHVKWREQAGDRGGSGTAVITLGTVEEHYRYGREEGVAALLLTEIVADEKASQDDRSNRVPHYGSLARMGAFDTALDEGRIATENWTLTREKAKELLGPDAQTLVSRTTVESQFPGTDRRAVVNDDFSSEDGFAEGAESDENQPVGARLSSDLEEIREMKLEMERPPIVADPEAVTRRKNYFSNTLKQYPKGLAAAFRDGNFGVASRLASTAPDPYEKVVLVYALYELFDFIEQIQDSEEAVRQISSAITAFSKAIARDDEEMARLSLKRASEAFLTVTNELLEGARPTIEDLRSVLAYHELIESFDRYVARWDELEGDSLAHYERVTEDLIDSARRQHERAEKAREAFHLYTER
ncbi:MAG: hypothetical protein ACOCY6_03975 [Halodesulfurarchaeum sp.]